jgi:hypothetical protein
MDLLMRQSTAKNYISPALWIISTLFTLLCCRPALGIPTTTNLLAKAILNPKPKERVSAYKVISEYQCPNPFCLQSIKHCLDQEVKNNFGFSEESADSFSTEENSLSHNKVEELSCMCKVLAFTSDPDCRATLEQVYGKLPINIKLKAFAEKCIEISNAYAETAPCWTTPGSGDADCEAKSVCMIKSSHPKIRVAGAKHIFWSLVNDDETYGTVVRILVETINRIAGQNNPEDYTSFPNEPVAVPNSTQEFLSWLSKSLGISGNPGYRKVLLDVLKKSQHLQLSKLAHHTKRALQLLKQTNVAYRQMDAVGKKYPHLSETEKKIICLIKSPFLYLKSFAAQHVYWSPAVNQTVIDIINSEALAKLTRKYQQYEAATSQADGFQNDTTVLLDSGDADVISWYCKVLKATDDTRYSPTLDLARKVASVTMSRKLKNALQ